MSNKNYIIRISTAPEPVPAKALNQDLGQVERADSLEASAHQEDAAKDAGLAFLDLLQSPGVGSEKRYAQLKLRIVTDYLNKHYGFKDPAAAREIELGRAGPSNLRAERPALESAASGVEDATAPRPETQPPHEAALRQSEDTAQDGASTLAASGPETSTSDESVGLKPPVPAAEPTGHTTGRAGVEGAAVHSPDARQMLLQGARIWRERGQDEAALAQAAAEMAGVFNVKVQTLIQLMRTISHDLSSLDPAIQMLESSRRNYTGVGGGQ
jgi:hypothetical protein